jgi:hypothetical protein
VCKPTSYPTTPAAAIIGTTQRTTQRTTRAACVSACAVAFQLDRSPAYRRRAARSVSLLSHHHHARPAQPAPVVFVLSSRRDRPGTRPFSLARVRSRRRGVQGAGGSSWHRALGGVETACDPNTGGNSVPNSDTTWLRNETRFSFSTTIERLQATGAWCVLALLV